jgi:hypothetical protein
LRAERNSDLSPPFGVFGDKSPELGGRQRQNHAAKFGKSRLHLWIRKRRVRFTVEPLLACFGMLALPPIRRACRMQAAQVQVGLALSSITAYTGRREWNIPSTNLAFWRWQTRLRDQLPPRCGASSTTPRPGAATANALEIRTTLALSP